MLLTSCCALVGDGLSPDPQKQHSDWAWVITGQDALAPPLLFQI